MVSIALVSDTHGRLDGRIATLVRDCDYAVHAGDIGGLAVLKALQPRRGEVRAVRGNNDVPAQWPAPEQAALESIPWNNRLELPGGLLVVTHGHRAGPVRERHERLRRRYPEARAIVYGHSHRLALDTVALPWVLNPGAAGRSRTFGGPSCLVLKADGERWDLEVHRFSPPKG